MTMLGIHYSFGEEGYRTDLTRARDVLQRAGDLGSANAYSSLANLDLHEEHIRDPNKFEYNHKLAAIGGSITSRTMLGAWDKTRGNIHRAYKHYMIAVICGDKVSLAKDQEGFKKDVVTKDEYANTLRLYQRVKDELMNDNMGAAEKYNMLLNANESTDQSTCS